MVFLVIAGADGSGKGTQTTLLAETFKKQGKKVAVFDFPDYDSFFGKVIAQYLRGELGKASEISPYLASLLYTNDRLLKKQALEQAIQEHDVVICNRYVEANIAHQAIKLPQEKRQAFIQWIETLEYEIFKLPKPDLTIFLAVPPDWSKTLVLKKQERAYLQGKVMDEHEADSNHNIEANTMYTLLSQRDDWATIQCVKDATLLPKTTILEHILETITQRFPELKK